MIKPGDLKDLPVNFLDTLREIEDFIIIDVCRRVAKEGQFTDTAIHQIKMAAKHGADIKALEKYISKATGAAIKDIDRQIRSLVADSIEQDNAVYRRAGYDPIDISRSMALSEIVEAGIRQTKGELRNITRSMGFRDMSGGFTHYRKIFERVMDTTSMLVLTGGMDYISATRIASKRLTENGLEYVNYKTGHFNRVDVAARRAIVTGVNQMAANMNENIIEKLGAEYVEVTAHSGARPDHKEWQGRVFHIGGAKDGYRDFESSTGYGSGAGLCGWNCRHSFFPFFPGISARAYSEYDLANIDPPDFTYNGKRFTYYEATQRQRAYETAIRKTKREILAADSLGDNELALAKSIRLKSQRELYKDFCRKGKLQMQIERTQVLGFDKKASGVARSRAIAHHKQWLKSIGAENTSLSTLEKYYQGKYNKNKNYKDLMDYTKEIKRGEISPLTSLSVYAKTKTEAEKKLIGIVTENGIKVSEVSSHFIARVLGNREPKKERVKKGGTHNIREGVFIDTAGSALRKPKSKVLHSVNGEKRIRYMSERCSVTISDSGRLIQTNPLKKR